MPWNQSQATGGVFVSPVCLFYLILFLFPHKKEEKKKMEKKKMEKKKQNRKFQKKEVQLRGVG